MLKTGDSTHYPTLEQMLTKFKSAIYSQKQQEKIILKNNMFFEIVIREGNRLLRNMYTMYVNLYCFHYLT